MIGVEADTLIVDDVIEFVCSAERIEIRPKAIDNKKNGIFSKIIFTTSSYSDSQIPGADSASLTEPNDNQKKAVIINIEKEIDPDIVQLIRSFHVDAVAGSQGNMEQFEFAEREHRLIGFDRTMVFF